MHMYESVHNVRASSKPCTLMTLILYIYSGTEGGREGERKSSDTRPRLY